MKIGRGLIQAVFFTLSMLNTIMRFTSHMRMIANVEPVRGMAKVSKKMSVIGKSANVREAGLDFFYIYIMH